VVGGIYAAGKLDVFTEWVVALQRLDVLRLLDWSLAGGAIFKGEKIIQVLTKLIGDRLIEELRIGFTAIATELATSREIWLNRGSLFEAIRASIAVPTIFAPVLRDRLVLVDGGIVNPVPVAPTLNQHTEVTIAVDLNGPDAAPATEQLPAEVSTPSADTTYRDRILLFLDSLRAAPTEEHTTSQLGFYDLAMRSMETMQRTITQLKLATYAPTMLIQIPRNACGFLDFYRAKDLIASGYERTQQALAQQTEKSEWNLHHYQSST
jgi:NTE family protein